MHVLCMFFCKYTTLFTLIQDCELLPEDLEKLVKSYKAVVQLELGEEFPEDPNAQLWGAIGAVFNSWMNQRAKTYRHGLLHHTLINCLN